MFPNCTATYEGVGPTYGVEVKELSPAVDIILPTGTPITGGSNEPKQSQDRLNQLEVY